MDREGGQVTRRTHYVGSVEVVWQGADLSSASGEYRRSIAGVALATYYAASGIDRVRYLHTDHLGSIVAMSDENGLIESRTGFDAWGQRRNGHDWSQVWQQWLFGITPAWAAHQLEVTPRGYTGHEHVDDMGLIHMNGRIYDALLGRFLQADPFVEDSTTLNRYTYVHNNPLAYTDPSGYFSLKKFFKIAAVVAISVYSGGTAAGAAWGLFGKAVTIGQAFAAAVVGGAITGAIASGSVEGALWGAFAGAVFFGIGQQFAGTAGEGGVLGTSYSGPELARASVAHGIAGGTIAEMQGGKFGHGFLSAGISKAATPAAMSISKNVFLQGAAVAIVGGTTSRISGGKFANGAVTAAMGFAFNQLPSSEGGDRSNDDQRGRNHHFQRVGSLDEDAWELIETVVPGRGHPVRGQTIDAGQHIALEFRSDAGPLPTDRWYARVSALPLDIDGTPQNIAATPSWFEPITYIVQTGNYVVGDTYTLNAGDSAPGGYRWSISIPPQAATHDNTSYRWINVYRRRSGQ